MNSLDMEIKREKLKNNEKRQNSLKCLSLTSVSVDISTYILLETIELAFSKFQENPYILICFLVKIIVFVVVALLILVSMMCNKQTLLLVSSMIYLILGLGLFCYLIIQEMNTSPKGGGMQPLVDSKPAIYYKIFINIIICLNIIAGIFRLLASIFILIYIRISKKIVKLNKQLNENLLITSRYKSANESSKNASLSNKRMNINSVNNSTISSIKRAPSEKINFCTFSEGEKRSSRNVTATTNNSNKTSVFTTMINNKYYHEKNNLPQDVNIYIHNNTDHNQMNNIHVHVYNFNNNQNFQKAKIPSIKPGTYESVDAEKDRYDNIESLYETPKRVTFLSDSPKIN